MTTYAIYDGQTVTRATLRGKAWHVDGRTTGDLLKVAEQGGDVRGWAPSKTDAALGRTYYPLAIDPQPTYNEDEESLQQVLALDTQNNQASLTWDIAPHSVETRKQRRQSKLDEGRKMLADAAWRVGAAWDTWRSDMSIQLQGLMDDTLAPKNVVWPVSPKPLNIVQ